MDDPTKDGQDDEIKVTDRRLFTADGHRVGSEERTPAPEEPPEPPHEEAGPPPAFETLVLGLVNTALIYLGEIEGPEGSEQNLAAARETIDMLGVLQEKTAGNLTPQEEALLNSLLYKLRMDFAERAGTR